MFGKINNLPENGQVQHLNPGGSLADLLTWTQISTSHININRQDISFVAASYAMNLR
jgi:hypothetical protein